MCVVTVGIMLYELYENEAKNTVYHANVPNIIEIRKKHSPGCFLTLYKGRLDSLDTMISQDFSV